MTRKLHLSPAEKNAYAGMMIMDQGTFADTLFRDISHIASVDSDMNLRGGSTGALMIAPFTNDCVNGCEAECIILPAARGVQTYRLY